MGYGKNVTFYKDTIRFTEDNICLAIESKGMSLSATDRKKQKEMFRKELVEKKNVSIVVHVIWRG